MKHDLFYKLPSNLNTKTPKIHDNKKTDFFNISDISSQKGKTKNLVYLAFSQCQIKVVSNNAQFARRNLTPITRELGFVLKNDRTKQRDIQISAESKNIFCYVVNLTINRFNKTLIKRQDFPVVFIKNGFMNSGY